MDLYTFLNSLLDILNEMSPYILLGFLIAGFLHEFVKPETMSRHLAGRGWKPVVKAALFGIPLPLCSCGVLPTAVGLHRQGASKGATTSFLIATPQTGVDSIAATYALLGLPLAIIRPIAALFGGFAGGMAVSRFDKEPLKTDSGIQSGCTDGCCSATGSKHEDVAPSFVSRVIAAVRYGLVDMVGNVGKWLVIGLIVAALITVYVPDEFLVSLSDRPLLAMLAMVVVAVPMYVCATGSIPIAMSLMLKGLNPGAAFVLLMAGPAANFASVMVLGRSLGKKATALYVGSVVVTALLFGLAIDYFLPSGWFGISSAVCPGSVCHHEAGIFPTLCTALLILALLYSFMVQRRHNHKLLNESDMTQTFTIEGMACNHCRMTVEKALASLPGVSNVSVDLSSGTASVEGEVEKSAVVKAISDAGFNVKD